MRLHAIRAMANLAEFVANRNMTYKNKDFMEWRELANDFAGFNYENAKESDSIETRWKFTGDDE